MQNAIKRHRLAKNLSQDALAKALNMSVSGFRKLERGERRLTIQHLAKISEVLGVFEQDLVSLENQSAKKKNDNLLQATAPEFVQLPIYFIKEFENGRFLIKKNEAILFQRPFFLNDTKDGFGFLIHGSDVEPTLQSGDMVFVNPRIPPIKERLCTFVCNETAESFEVLVRRLVWWDNKSWFVKTELGSQEAALDRGLWREAFVIVGCRYA